ncbi:MULTISPECIES: DUF3365 domain-containing protein [unclassified Thiocapsa]|uniref:DUF3365 domain-containing protein n=1 Tax=unclassified Thiocapsa TaxID=2641286 RepID=UPI0035AEE559
MRKGLLMSFPLILASTASLAQEGVQDADLAEANALVERFATTLQKELKAAMTEGGPQNAVKVCRERAPAIAAAISEESGWTVGRTSLKLRNAELNAPDEWERAVLVQFDERKVAGEDVATMTVAEVVESDEGRRLRFMKAIPTVQLCLSCHGKIVNANVNAALADAYPEDQARGYEVGDVRGAFTLSRPR